MKEVLNEVSQILLQEFSAKLRKYLEGTSEGISEATPEGTPEGIRGRFSYGFPGETYDKI